MTTLAVAAVVLGWGLLAASSRRMRDLLPARLRTATRWLAVGGSVGLLLGIVLFVRGLGWSFGPVYFAAWGMLSGIGVVLWLTSRLER